ncbi:hypothetical protein CM240_0095 [Clostridium bornimense]|uniref:DUF4956 domain-containing protein n=1 Tax=Clostridium bornimense TaxID=1216932 RepID=W6RUG0_9CLOT|nr:DUF4956 domain-containing protein [Clostridium bornimense]CDM67274.1 hypothetical protein CM240_0095 [Clostridium bornimense]
MLETIIKSTTGESFTFTNSLIVIFTSIILGVVICASYMKIHKEEVYSQGFTTTLIMLPVIISIIILLVGNNVARAFSLAGAFSIIRFRSAPGNSRDIAYIFFTLAVGLACGMGYIGYAIIFTVILCAVMFILNITKFTEPKTKMMTLKITIPEDLNFDGIFDDILNRYTTSWNISRIRTRDFGSLFEINYDLSIKPEINQKQFIDEIRCKNGNLNISLTRGSSGENTF